MEQLETQVADKAVFWVDAGDSFKVTNCGSEEYRQIYWEFKAAPKRSEERVREMLKEAKFTTDVGTELLFENAYCRAWDFCLPPGGGDASKPHHHVLDYAFVYVAKGDAAPYQPRMNTTVVNARPMGPPSFF